MFPRYQSRQIKPRYEWRPRLDPSHPLSIGCVGLWLLNETGGPTVYDISGFHNDGTLTNGPLWTPGRSGQALTFDGADDIVKTAVTSFITNGTQGHSAFAWVYPNNVLGSKAAWNCGEFNDFDLSTGLGIIDNGVNWFRNGVAAGVASGLTISANQWSFIGFSRISSTQVIFFVNGVVATIDSTSAGAIGATDPHLIGAAARNGAVEGFWSGIIDQTRVYNRALSANEIQWLYEFPYDNIIVEPTRKFWMIPEAAGGAAWLKQGYWWNRNYGGMG